MIDKTTILIENEKGGSFVMQYVVQRGDTLYLIAQRFGLNVYQLIEANHQITNPDYLYIGQVINIPVSGQALPTLYIIKSGDNLSSIARRFGIPLSLLLDANPQITNPDYIVPGMQIVIPSPTPAPGVSIYIVVPGDTLYSIAQKFRTTLSSLLELNPGITNPALIFPGQQILVPLPSPLEANGCIVFASNRSGKTELWMTTPLGEQQTQLTGKAAATSQLADDPVPQWSPDGLYVAFLGKSDSNSPLYILKLCDEEKMKLADNVSRFSWSNIGNRIAYSNDEGTFIVTLDGITQKVSDKLYNPVWYPDDKTIFGYTYVEALPYEIMASVDVNGQNFKAYENPIIPADSVRISPNGRYIAINTATGKPYYVVAEVAIYDLNSKQLVALPGNEIVLSDGSIYDINLLGGWSPDSSKLVYSTLVNTNGYAEIRIASAQGTVLKSYGRGFYPDTRWSPVPELIMYTLSEKAGNSVLVPTKPRNIYVLNIMTNQQVKVTSIGDNYNPDWTAKPCPECK